MLACACTVSNGSQVPSLPRWLATLVFRKFSVIPRLQPAQFNRTKKKRQEDNRGIPGCSKEVRGGDILRLSPLPSSLTDEDYQESEGLHSHVRGVRAPHSQPPLFVGSISRTTVWGRNAQSEARPYGWETPSCSFSLESQRESK